MKIERVAVIGAGVMGSGIAAHIANAGIPVDLLDIVPKDAKNRSVIAETALEKMQKTDPSPLMHKGAIKLITPGNLEDHLDRLGQADWIIEAVIENLDIKRDLYKKIDKVRKKGAIVSSNTSTIPLKVLVEGESKEFAQDFLITHFFNPPRYMRLLELVVGEKTRPEVVKTIDHFADLYLGKTVVYCHDTPSFIANRIGTFWIQKALIEAFDMGLSVEAADLVNGRPFGIPKTGVFALVDLVGLDLMPHIGKSMLQSLPKTDRYHAIYKEPELITKMIADGYTGRKGKGGFYRLVTEGGKKIKEAIDLKTGQYHPAKKIKVPGIEAADKNLLGFLSQNDKFAHYAWKVFSDVLCYAASLVPEIADNIVAVDEAMRLGYNWKYGPFELIDRIGVDWFIEKLREDKIAIPPLLEKAAGKSFYTTKDGILCYLDTKGVYQKVERRSGVLLLSDIKRTSKPLARNGSASLWDIGDGVACLEFTSKMNAIDLDIMNMIKQSIEIVAEKFKALVIYNEGTHFSAGANIGLALFASNIAMWEIVTDMVNKGQEVYQALKYSPFPVVAAPSGMALGGGCEILLHTDAVQAHAESYIGLVEVGVGLVPAWGGCKELLTRWYGFPKRPGGPMPVTSKAFETIMMATVAKSAFEAKELLFLRQNDGITMNRDRLLADAKAKALALAENYTVPQPIEISLAGPTAKEAIRLAIDGFVQTGKASAYDREIGLKLATILSGGDTDITEKIDEDTLLLLERTAFMDLVHQPQTLARIEHILETGKPLRN